MPRIYQISRAGLKLIYKIRHHRGHGIHSPFVFNLVTNVIEEKKPYYAYSDIQQYLNTFAEKTLSINKVNRLAFRLVNYFEAKNILEIGSGKGVNTLFLSASSKDIICHCIELDPVNLKIAKELYSSGWNSNIILSSRPFPSDDLLHKQDCIYINLKNYIFLSDDNIEQITALIHDKSFIIVEGIRTNRMHRVLWKSISEIGGRTAMLDLFNIGILFFDKSLQRWDYQISF